MTRTLLIDGNNLLARAHHASLGGKVEMFANGTNTSALVIFIGLISKYVRQVQPDRMAVLWDAGHALRDAAYPAYKAARAKPEGDGDSMPLTLAKEFLTWACVPHKAHQGYEADDLIAATARQTPGEVVILSGDKDLLQLIDDRRGVTQIRVPDDQPWTEVDVERKFGVPPHLLSHYLALVGDPGDGVPGVSGLGPKKSLALLEQAEWDWEAVGDLLGPERAKVASLMHSLVDLRSFPYNEAFMASNVGAPIFTPADPNRDPVTWGALIDFCDKYQLKEIRQRLEAGVLWVDRSPHQVDVFADLDSPAVGA